MQGQKWEVRVELKSSVVPYFVFSLVCVTVAASFLVEFPLAIVVL